MTSPANPVSLLTELVLERTGCRGHGLEVSDVSRYSATIDLLPRPPATVLDVGCGAGVLVDALSAAGYGAEGVDTDAAAMASMRAPHRIATISDLPWPDRAFDAVVCGEVLEHLPVDVFAAGLVELARVASRRVVVTVPNAESLEAATTRCPGCGCVYSIHGHVRRFEPSDMTTLIPGFTLTSLQAVGPFKVRHRLIEWYVRRRLLGRWPSQPGAVCPQCGLMQAGRANNSARAGRTFAHRAARFAAAVPWRRWWLAAAYDRPRGT
jgi:SAM-dependent methyltransferase